jgi:3-hydroxymyristoyl/3-hydroxydecanoyl-(acyl carrier protein) dehydratase
MSSRPVVRAVRRSDDGVELDLFVPGSLDFFPDHFARLGMVPGVVQVDWAITLAREHLGATGPFRGLRALKFQSPILRDTALTLALTRAPGEIGFAYRAGDKAYSSGRALFGAAGASGGSDGG